MGNTKTQNMSYMTRSTCLKVKIPAKPQMRRRFNPAMMERAQKAMNLASVEIRPVWADWKPQCPEEFESEQFTIMVSGPDQSQASVLCGGEDTPRPRSETRCAAEDNLNSISVLIGRKRGLSSISMDLERPLKRMKLNHSSPLKRRRFPSRSPSLQSDAMSEMSDI